MSVDGSDSDVTEVYSYADIVDELTGQVVNENKDTERVEGHDDGEKVEESMECEPCGGSRIPVTLRSPMKPSAEDIAAHNLTHLPYRNWCPVCVAAKAREDAHPRSSGQGEDGGVPIISMDYNFVDGKNSEDEIKMIVAKHEPTGLVVAYTVTAKGPSDGWVVKRLAQDIEEFGQRDIILKTDGEPAIVSLQGAVQGARQGRTIPRNPPAYNPQSNGACEKGVQDVTGQVRLLKLALEARLGVAIPQSARIMDWMIPHGAFLVSKYSVGHDGMTAYERLNGRKWSRPIVEFGEVVLGKLATRRIGKGRQRRQKSKLAERSLRGVWVGQISRTGEHIIIKDDGDTVRCRAINRVPEEDRWNVDLVMAIKGVPRRPAPLMKKSDAIQSRLVDEEANRRRVQPQRRQPDGPGDEIPKASGAGLGQAQPRAPREIDIRRFRITDKVLEKYSASDQCPGCEAKAAGRTHRPHSEACRQRIYAQMFEDERDKEFIVEEEKKMKKKAELRSEKANKNEPDIPHDNEPKEDSADIDGFIDEDAAADHDIDMEGENVSDIPELAESEVLESPSSPPECFDFHSDSDGEPSSKKAKISALSSKSNIMEKWVGLQGEIPNRQPARLARRDETATRGGAGITSFIGAREHALRRPDASTPTTTVGRTIAGIESSEDRVNEIEGYIAKLNTVAAKPDVKEILKDLEKNPAMQLPKNRRQRRSMNANGKYDVSELYSPPRITAMAKQLGMKDGWALDLTITDETDGKPWDFSDAKKRQKAKDKIELDKPLMIVLCPMCGPFSTLQNVFNYPNMSAEDVKTKLESALEHVKFCLELCVRQHAAGRLFMFEHPVGASSWGTQMMNQVANMNGVMKVNFDFCAMDMKTKDVSGEMKPAKKRTTVLTNSAAIATLLREAQCTGLHEHVPLLEGRAGPCQEYTDKFCRIVCEGIKREIDTIKWRNRLCKVFDISTRFSQIMALQSKIEDVVVPPEEDNFDMLYKDNEFIDDVTGAPLDKAMAITARRTEMEYVKDMGVYTKVRKKSWMKVISTKWLDVNKGDVASPNYRARLVGREIKKDRRTDLFAATPPLESLRMVLSKCASNQHHVDPLNNFIVMSNDVKRAYFYAPATRPVYIAIPSEDFEEGDEEKVGMLNLSLYGTRDAAMNWAIKFTNVLEGLGFEKGRCSPCNFYNRAKDITLTVHGDDFTSTGREANLRWLKTEFAKNFEIKTDLLGPNPERHQQEIRILNRVVTWGTQGICYEADQRHAEILVRELGLHDAKSVSTPGTREEANRASTIDTGIDVDDLLNAKRDPKDEELLQDAEATTFRALTARANYLAQDRPDAQYAVKEIARRMAAPRRGDWELLKRFGRYLRGAPRAVFHYYWQQPPTSLDAYVDSDWAGCKTSGRSTSGGAVLHGWHVIKSWSTTQAIVAMSSAEAELYAMTKGAANTLGIMSLGGDFGMSLDAKVHTDASAALGIVNRQGLGKLRHIRVQYLWLQGRVKDGDVEVHKVPGQANPADLLTKHLAAHDMQRHLTKLCVEVRSDRAGSAPQLSRVSEVVDDADDHNDLDDWDHLQYSVVRRHGRPRRSLFTPLRVRGSPPVRALTPVRITEGRFCDTGEKFRRTDAWTTRSTSHLSMPRRWTGTTTFLLRSQERSSEEGVHELSNAPVL